MKKIIVLFVLITQSIFAQVDSVQVYKTSWYLGGSLMYPRYMSISAQSIAEHNNFGLGLHLGYNITEHFGFRLTPNYVLLQSTWTRPNNISEENYVNMFTINLEAIYNILPCEIISPFILVGYGATFYKSSNPYAFYLSPNHSIHDWQDGYQATLGIGAEYKMMDEVSLKAEFNYVTASNNRIDGNLSINESKGLLQSNGDTYMTLNLGAIWYFSRGEKSKICQPFSIREVIKEIPVEVEKVVIDTVYIDRVIEKAIKERESFVLENVRFKFDQDVLTNEGEIILQNVANVMNKYPSEKFEILGHTDSWGTDEYNLDLSKRRALSVKRYLIKMGVDSTRLFTAGCGERMPIADNSTSNGRAINRRIEFSIYDGIIEDCEKAEEQKPKEDKKVSFKNTEQQKIADRLSSGEKLSFSNINFKVNSDIITEESMKILDNVADVLFKLPDLKLQIEGHTDSDGSKEYNQNLSERRAESVKKYLVEKGISSERLSTVGYGELYPIVKNDTQENKRKNRRIEFKKID